MPTKLPLLGGGEREPALLLSDEELSCLDYVAGYFTDSKPLVSRLIGSVATKARSAPADSVVVRREEVVDCYLHSTDGESYYGRHASLDDALKAGIVDAKDAGQEFLWVGHGVDPPSPEIFWAADDWLEHVSVQDDYSGEWAEDWDGSDAKQRAELEAEVRLIMAAWLTRHELRPLFRNIVNERKYTIAEAEAALKGAE